MKRSTKIILIALMVVTLILSVTACANDTAISVSENPQTTFVKGNDLDLSAGKLNVVKGGETSEIAMNAEGVTVSGYDKNTVGDQTVTISYNGASVAINVKVVERIVAVGHETNYVLGQAFDNKGSLRITKDNGESITVSIKDDKVHLSGFDSATAGKKTVNVTYTDGSQTFNGSFEVNVYSVDSARLTPPTQITYSSHDTEINVAGGYLSVTANGGAVNVNIPLQAEWIKSFNFESPALTDEKPKMMQTLTVEYLGQSFNFTVNVNLSDVTRIRRAAAALSGLDWTKNTAPAITDEQGKIALNALARYNDLYEGYAALLSDEEVLSVVRTAAVYGKTAWISAAEQFDALFSVKFNDLTIDCEDLEATKTQFPALSALENDSALLKYGDILLNKNALAEFSETTLFGEEVYSKYLADICSGEAVKKAIKKIDLMLKMDEALAVVPESWQLSDLQTESVSAKIDEATAYAVELGEISEAIFERYLFNTVSDWRKNSDYFEILYRYYFDMTLNEDETVQEAGITAIDSLMDLCLPGILETYYLQYISALIEQSYLEYTLTDTEFVPAGSLDTYYFIDAYFTLIDIKNEVAASEDEMIKTLYSVYQDTFDNFVYSVELNEGGVFGIFGAEFGVKEFADFWKLYIKVVKDVTKGADGYQQEIENLLEQFVNLSPEFQMQFLASANAYGVAEFDPDDDTERSTLFAGLIVYYYSSIMPDLVIDGNKEGIVYNLFYALECFLYRDELIEEDGDETYMDEFLSVMGDIQTAYAALDGENKALFDNHIGFFYQKYVSLRGKFDENGNFINRVSEEDWAEWKEAIEGLDTMYTTLYAVVWAAMSDYSYYPLFVSAYEATAALYNDIMTNAPQTVKDIVLYSTSNALEGFQASPETLMYQLYRSLYLNCLMEYPIDDENVFAMWLWYNDTKLPEHMASLFGFFVSSMSGENPLTLDTIKKAITDFQGLSDSEKAAFILLDGQGSYMYYNAIVDFMTESLSDSSAALSLARYLLSFEITLWLDDTVTDGVYVTVWEQIKAMYDILSNEDKALFDENLGVMYEYYQDIYDNIKAEQAAPEAPSEPEA